jgi:hypothetical protein
MWLSLSVTGRVRGNRWRQLPINDGATTPGVDNTTLDGFSEERVASIIARLKNGSYRFRPARRTYVAKKHAKKRPLGISSGDDKLVHEVGRIILERIYEPICANSSHGFRPGRSPPTAVEQLGEPRECDQVDGRHGHTQLLRHHRPSAAHGLDFRRKLRIPASFTSYKRCSVLAT